MTRSLTLLSILILFSQCNTENAKYRFTSKKVQVAIQPFDGFPKHLIDEAQAAFDSLYHVETTILDPIPLPKMAYYSPRNRYRADSLIRYLRKIKPKPYKKIIGLTTSDISTTKGDYKDYGIMGLGFRPGASSVVSTYRIQRGAKDKDHLRERFWKVTSHELGHNFGLKHCTYDDRCMMRSARGKATNIDSYYFGLCENCQRQIKAVLKKK